jgi:hypothetical protein
MIAGRSTVLKNPDLTILKALSKSPQALSDASLIAFIITET